ncbi:DUF2314 domain-containing protein [Campylobacter sp. RM16188]|uniref:DUF2314 domain-containing protein n=1 Tax=Campylobacter sp. RM16188 TaxID=1705725 RepID=UPI003464182A
MSFFKKIFGKQRQEDTGEKMPIYYVDSEQDAMSRAYQAARDTFGYFWRELYWDRRRIVPGVSVACVKVLFKDETNGEEIGEHMWINDIEFDGENVSGILVNEPNDVKNIKNGDFVKVPLSEVSDWLFVIDNKSYGGFSVHALRANMSDKERAEHDLAWGFEFGDFNDILVAYEQKEYPENLIEHPMCKNVIDQVREYITNNPNILSDVDELGYTQLHHEAIAGNLGVVEILLENGADKNAKTNSGKTALDFAKALKWEHIARVL